MYQHGFGVTQDIGIQKSEDWANLRLGLLALGGVDDRSGLGDLPARRRRCRSVSRLDGLSEPEPERRNGAWQISGGNGGALVPATEDGPYYFMVQLTSRSGSVTMLARDRWAFSSRISMGCLRGYGKTMKVGLSS